MSLEKQIKEWVSIDNKLKMHQEMVKELRSQRNEIGSDILMYVNTNKLDNAVIEISDGRLKFNNTKITSPLTFRFIKDCLNDCITDTKIVEQIIEHIKNKRDIKYIKDIKRFYNK